MIITYTATIQLPDLPANRSGFVQTIDTTDKSIGRQMLTEMQPLKANDNFVLAEVGDQTVVEVTNKGEGYKTGQVVIPYMDDELLPYWTEFHESTRKRQVFGIDASMIRGHYGTYDAMRTDNGTAPEHRNARSKSQYSFSFRVLN